MQRIEKYLSDIEKDKGIKILLACETGSRGWGFPSPDSDYDIRIIYVHSKDWYLSLSEKKDSLEMMFEQNEIDITGWDLRKSLRLLQKSNAALLERIQSPIIYRQDKTFLDGILELAKVHYSRIATMHHYLSMGKGFLTELKAGESYKLKKFFYALRAAIATKWIFEKEDLVPIEFVKMMDGLDISKELKVRIKELIRLKSTISESYMHSGEESIIAFMKDCIRQAEKNRLTLPVAKGCANSLDEFFIQTIDANEDRL